MNADEVAVEKNQDGVRRILVLAHEGLGGDPLIELLDQHAADPSSEIFVVVPALTGSVNRLANDDRGAIAAAETDLQRLLSEIGSKRRVTGGLVGDPDPRLALEDVLRQFAADEIVIVNPPETEMDGREQTSTARALKDVPLPVKVLHVPAF